NNPTFTNQITATYESIYKDKPIIRILRTMPQLNEVVGTNYVNLGFRFNYKTYVLSFMVVLYNLIKGASGQALQNINLM
ncbi:UNVERIFIED_CONTAM: N-acetyl-gamma-glutamyl-phosphate reductase, partial [Escherichia coli]